MKFSRCKDGNIGKQKLKHWNIGFQMVSFYFIPIFDLVNNRRLSCYIRKIGQLMSLNIMRYYCID